MIKHIKIDDKLYTVTNGEMISATEDLIFEFNDGTYMIGLFDDILGSPISKVWKILNIE